LCTQGRVSVDGQRCLDPASRISPDAAIVIDTYGPKLSTRPLAQDAVVFFDRDLVIVDKPAGMLSVADDSDTKDTVADHLRTLLRRLDSRYADAKLGVVHRLDKDTSGVMVFARTIHAKRALAAQFRAHDIERIYHALANGDVAETRIETYLTRDRGDGLRGSHGRFGATRSEAPAGAKWSVTYVRPIERLAGATLVECRLETGRQHQIRIHLSELGHPLLGEHVYNRDHKTAMIRCARIMLHACKLAFTHPRSGERVAFERVAPDDFQKMIESLRSPHRGGSDR
jgi:23S rRNA pseudouridine1911/1915/1917 synthase